MGNKKSTTVCSSCISPKPRKRIVNFVDESHQARSTQWVPPRENWSSHNSLPHGWEEGINRTGKSYYINHVKQTTTGEEPRVDREGNEEEEEVEEEEADDSNVCPHPREVELIRDPEIGFGFVAGSEKPVIVRFVTEDGPSKDKLMPGDHIHAINGEDVKTAAREHVIQLVKSCQTSMSLTVCQPQIDNSQRKSALLTAAKRAKLKSNPSRVRFAEAVCVSGTSASNTTNESYVPFMPNVLKVFLENGQTKSFKYDSSTTVRDVLDSMQQKLGITCIEHFALVLQNLKGVTQSKMSLLRETECLAEIASRPGSQHFRCLFRVAFVPHDAYDLLRKDTTAFEYFFTQCCNDIVKERYSSELKYDVTMRLAALQIQEHLISNHASPNKVSVKSLAKEPGLDHFLPATVLDSSKGKDIRKMLSHYLRATHSLTAPGQKQLTALQAKLHYLKIVSELKTFGAKSFIATFVERKIEVMLSVGHRHGICLVANIKNNRLTELAQFQHLGAVQVEPEGESMLRVQLQLVDHKHQPITLLMLTDDASDFVALVNGYYRLFVDTNKSLVVEVAPVEPTSDEVPVYRGRHRVIAEQWSYPDDLVSEVVTELNNTKEVTKPGGAGGSSCIENERFIDLSNGPPSYEGINAQYIAKIKEDLGLQVEKEVKTDKSRSQLPNVSPLFRAPLASPDTSTISGSSDSTEPSESTTVIASLPSPGVTSNESTSDVVDVTKDDSDFCGGSTLTLVADGDTVANGSTTDGLMSLTDASSLLHSSATASKPVAGSVDSIQGVAMKSAALTSYIGSFSAASASALAKQLVTQDDSTAIDADATMTISESDDTDTMSTPTNSPAKGRLQTGRPMTLCRESDTNSSSSTLREDESILQRDSFANRSFGLCSPDKAALTEQMHPSYNPRLFVDGGLYLDPDIIDLTLLPPPKTPDFEAIPSLELPSPGSAAAPPPGFSDTASLPDRSLNSSSDSLPAYIRDLPTSITEKIDALVMNDEDLISQMPAIEELLRRPLSEDNGKESGIESESDSGNETISCENVDASTASYQEFLANAPSDAFGQRCSSKKLPVDLDALDIDAFIASVTVPPPPKDDVVEPQTTQNAVGKSVEVEPSMLRGASAGMTEEPLWKQLLVTMPTTPMTHMAEVLEEEFAKLVTPPPPSSTETELRDIAIVPPVDVKTPSPTLGESLLTAVEFRNGTDVTAVFSSLDLSDSCTSSNVKALPSPTTKNTSDAVKMRSPSVGEYKRSVSSSDVERLGSRPRSKPPVPPKRFSSLDANSTSSSSTPTSSPRGSVHSVDSASGSTAPQSNNDNIENLQQRLRFWRPTEVSKSCCSPSLPNGLHPTLAQNGAAVNSSSQVVVVGSLTRPKKKPPPPPPRRSSMLGKLDENVDNSAAVLATNGGADVAVTSKNVAVSPTNSNSSPIYSNTTCASPQPAQSMSQNMNGNITIASDSDTSRSRLKPQISASIQERQQAIQSCFRTDVEYVAIKTNVPKSPTVARSHTFSQTNNSSKLHPHGGSTGASSLQKHSSFSHVPGDGQRRFQTFFADDSVTASGSQVTPEPKMTPLKQETALSPVVTSPVLYDSRQQMTRRTSASLMTLPSPSRNVHARSASFDQPTNEGMRLDEGRRAQPGSDECMAGIRKGLAPWQSTCERRSASTSVLPNSNFFKARTTNQVSMSPPGAAIQRTTSCPTEPPAHAPPPPPSSEAPSGGDNLLSPEKSNSIISLHNNAFVISPEEVIGKTYDGIHTLSNANKDVDALLLVISESIRASNSSVSHNQSCVCDGSEFTACKEALVAESRQFVTDSKLLVSSATQSREKLVANINTSMHTLAKIVRQMHAVMTLTSGTSAASLGMKVKEVAMSYRATVNAAHNAAGRPLSDPCMKQLMRQATSLASKLSALMRTLKSIENR